MEVVIELVNGNHISGNIDNNSAITLENVAKEMMDNSIMLVGNKIVNIKNITYIEIKKGKK